MNEPTSNDLKALFDIFPCLKSVFKNKCKNKNLAEKFLKISEMDLAVSKLLYEHEYYAASIFHLQQASEKSIKSFGLYFNIISEKDIGDIKHSTAKFFEIMFKKSFVGQILDKLNFDGIAKDYKIDDKRVSYTKEETIAYLKGLSKDNAKVVHSTSSELNSTINLIDNIVNKLKGTFNNEPSKIISILLYSLIFTRLSYHEVPTRYPTNYGSPLDYKRGKLGIIDVYDSIVKKIEFVNQFLREEIPKCNKS